VPNQSNNPQNRTEAERHRIGEEELQFQRERAAENRSTANGLMIGGLLALAGLGAAMAYYLSRPTPTPTTIINTPPKPAAAVSPPPPKVIEVPKTVIVPGPTKIIEVPKPVAAPETPTTTDRLDAPKPSPKPSAAPSPPASDSEPLNVPSPGNTNTGNN